MCEINFKFKVFNVETHHLYTHHPSFLCTLGHNSRFLSKNSAFAHQNCKRHLVGKTYVLIPKTDFCPPLVSLSAYQIFSFEMTENFQLLIQPSLKAASDRNERRLEQGICSGVRTIKLLVVRFQVPYHVTGHVMARIQ